MKYYCLSSGSKGNSTAFENENGDILLIDCGLSLKELQKRFVQANLNFNRIQAVIITHLHKDHCSCLRAFDKNIIYAHYDSMLDLDTDHQLHDYDTVNLLGFELFILPMSHDIDGTIGFLMTYQNEKLAYITDTGYVHINLQRMINNCNYYLIESNYDPRMLMLSNRPLYLKQRILSIKGHLSNEDCSVILANVMGPDTKEICFIHRSLETNSEDLILQTFKSVMKNKDINTSHILLKIAKQDRYLESRENYEPQI